MSTNDKYSSIVKSALSTTSAPTQDHGSIVKQALSSSAGSRTDGWYQIDGDTDRGPDGTRHRYDGVDTPEMGRKRVREEQILAGPARERAAELRESGYDQAVKSGEGKYGRELTDFRNADGESIGEVLIREGYAKPWRGSDGLRFRDAYLDMLQSYDRGETIPALERAHPELYAVQQQMSYDTLDVLSDAYNRGVHQTLGGGATGMQWIGKTLGWDKLENWSEEAAFSRFKEAAQYPMRIENIGEVDDLADAWLYFVETIGGEAFNTAGDAALMATGAGVGVVAARRMAYAGMMKTLMSKGPVTPQMIQRASALQRSKAANIGAQSALHTSLGIQMTGQTYGQMLAEGIEDPNFWSVAGTAAVNTVLQGAAMNQLMGLVRVDRAAALGSATDLLKKVATDLGVTITAQGGVEGAVQLLNELAVKGEKPEYDINTLAIWDAAARGAVFGGTSAVVSAGGQGAAYGLSRNPTPANPLGGETTDQGGVPQGGAPTMTDPTPSGREEAVPGHSRREMPTEFSPQSASVVQQEAADLLDTTVQRDTMVVHPDNMADVQSVIGQSDARVYEAQDGMFTVTRDPNITQALETNAERQQALGYFENKDNLRADAPVLQVFAEDGTQAWNEGVNTENVAEAKERLRERFPGRKIVETTPDAEQQGRAERKNPITGPKVNTKPKPTVVETAKPFPTVPQRRASEITKQDDKDADALGIGKAYSVAYPSDVAKARQDLVKSLQESTGQKEADARAFVHNLTDDQVFRLAEQEGVQLVRDLGNKTEAIRDGMTSLMGRLRKGEYAGRDFSQLFEALGLKGVPDSVMQSAKGDNTAAYDNRVLQYLTKNKDAVAKAINKATPEQQVKIETALGLSVKRKRRPRTAAQKSERRAGLRAAIAERRSAKDTSNEAEARGEVLREKSTTEKAQAARERIAARREKAKAARDKIASDRAAAQRERDSKVAEKRSAALTITQRVDRLIDQLKDENGYWINFDTLRDMAYAMIKRQSSKKAKDHDLNLKAEAEAIDAMRRLREIVRPTIIEFGAQLLTKASQKHRRAAGRILSKSHDTTREGAKQILSDVRIVLGWLNKDPKAPSVNVITSRLQEPKAATRLWATIEMLLPDTFYDGSNKNSVAIKDQVALRIHKALLLSREETLGLVVPMIEAVMSMVNKRVEMGNAPSIVTVANSDLGKMRAQILREGSDSKILDFNLDLSGEYSENMPNVMFKPERAPDMTTVFNIKLSQDGKHYETDTLPFFSDFKPTISAHHGSMVGEQRYSPEESSERTLWFALKEATLHISKSLYAGLRDRLEINQKDRLTKWDIKSKLLDTLGGVKRNAKSAFEGKDIVAIDFELYYDDEVSLSKMTIEEYLARPEVYQTFTMSYARRENGKIVKGVLNGDAEIRAYIDSIRDQDVTISAHNASFDARILMDKFGLHKPFLDSMHMHMMLNPVVDPEVQRTLDTGDFGWNSLANVSRLVSRDPKDHKQVEGDALGNTKGKTSLTAEEQASLEAYNEQDAVAGLRVTEELGYFMDAKLVEQADLYLQTTLGDINALNDMSFGSPVFGAKLSGVLRDKMDRINKYNEANGFSVTNLLPVTRTLMKTVNGQTQIVSEFVVMVDTTELASYGKGSKPKTTVEAETRLYDNLTTMTEGGLIRDNDEGGILHYKFTMPALHDGLVLSFDPDSGRPKTLGDARDARRLNEYERSQVDASNKDRRTDFSDLESMDSDTLEVQLDEVDAVLSDVLYSNFDGVEAVSVNKADAENIQAVLGDMLDDDASYVGRVTEDYTRLTPEAKKLAKLVVVEDRTLYDFIQDRYDILGELQNLERQKSDKAQTSEPSRDPDLANESEGERQRSWDVDSTMRADLVNANYHDQLLQGIKDAITEIDEGGQGENSAERKADLESLATAIETEKTFAEREKRVEVDKRLRDEYLKLVEGRDKAGAIIESVISNAEKEAADNPREHGGLAQPELHGVDSNKKHAGHVVAFKKQFEDKPREHGTPARNVVEPKAFHNQHVADFKNMQQKLKEGVKRLFRDSDIITMFSNKSDAGAKKVVGAFLRGAKTLMRINTPLAVVDYNSIKDLSDALKDVMPKAQFDLMIKEISTVRDRGEYGYYNAGQFAVIIVPNNVRTKTLEGRAQHLLKIGHEFGHMAYDAAYKSLFQTNATPDANGRYELTDEGKALNAAFLEQSQAVPTRKNYNFKEWFADQTARAVMDLAGTISKTRSQVMDAPSHTSPLRTGGKVKGPTYKQTARSKKLNAELDVAYAARDKAFAALKKNQNEGTWAAYNKTLNQVAETERALIVEGERATGKKDEFLSSDHQFNRTDAKLERLEKRVETTKATLDKVADPKLEKESADLVDELKTKQKEVDSNKAKIVPLANTVKNTKKYDVASKTRAEIAAINKEIASIQADMVKMRQRLARVRGQINSPARAKAEAAHVEAVSNRDNHASAMKSKRAQSNPEAPTTTTESNIETNKLRALFSIPPFFARLAARFKRLTNYIARQLKMPEVTPAFDAFMSDIIAGKVNTSTLSNRYDGAQYFNGREKLNEARASFRTGSMSGIASIFRTAIGDIERFNPILAKMLFQRPGSDSSGKAAYDTSQLSLERKLHTIVSSTLGKIDGSLKNTVGMLVGKESAALKQAFADYRVKKDTAGAKHLNRMFQEIDTIAREQMPEYKRSGRIPFAFDHRIVELKRNELMDMIRDTKPFEGLTEADLRDRIEIMLDGGGNAEFAIGPGMPVGMHEFTSSIVSLIGEQKLIDEGFLLDKPTHILTHFISGLSKRGAWEGTFGAYVDGSDKPVTQRKPGDKVWRPNALYLQHEQLVREQFGEAAAQEVRQVVRGMLGHRVRDMNPVARRIQESLINITSWALLPFAGVATIPEVATPMVRALDAISMRDIISSLGDTKWARQFAQDIGLILPTVYNQMSRMTDQGYEAVGTRAVTGWFFVANGQVMMSNLARTVGVAIGRQYLIRTMQNGDTAALTRLNVTAEQVQTWIDNGMGSFRDGEGSVQQANDAVTKAIHQFVDEGTLDPSRAQGPSWFNNPYAATIAYLKRFLWAFGDVVIGGAYRGAERIFKQGKAKGYSSPAALASAMLPYMAVGAVLVMLGAVSAETREWLKGGDRLRKMDSKDYWHEAFARAGGYGVFEVFRTAQRAMDFNRSVAGSLVAPIGVLEQTISFNDSDPYREQFWEKIKFLLPFL